MIINKKSSEKSTRNQLVEIMDDNNQPLAVLPKDVAHRQLLRHRSVQVLIFNPEKKIYLQKRNSNKQFFPGRWDISARTHPRVGEATYDAALRIVHDELNLDVENLVHLRDLKSCPETGFEYVSLFTLNKNTQLITPEKEEASDGYYYSREELTCLVKEFRELLTPNLVTLWEAGLLVES